MIRDRSHDAFATQPMTPPEDAHFTIPVRASGPLTPSSSQSGSRRVYCRQDGTPKPITRPVKTPEPPSDPLAGQSHICPSPVLYFSGKDVANEARHHLRDGGNLLITATIMHKGCTMHCTIAGCAPDGCYFSAEGQFQQGNFDGLWNSVTRQWPALRDATWTFAPSAPSAAFDAVCWARVKATKRLQAHWQSNCQECRNGTPCAEVTQLLIQRQTGKKGSKQ